MNEKLLQDDSPITGNAAPRQRRGLPFDRYMGLTQLAGYSGLCVRKLRALIKDPLDPLPSFRVHGKILVKQSHFDAWMERFRVKSEIDVDKLVCELTEGE